jgi:uncharacterized protein (TIGR03435 family)
MSFICNWQRKLRVRGIWIAAACGFVSLAGSLLRAETPAATQAAAGQPDSEIELKVGDRAPELAIEEWLGSPDGSGPDVSQKKAILIEFWATWCAPCIEGIPHLNALADAMGDRVQFIAVTSEADRALVEKFLERKPIHAHVGLDTDESLSRDFNVQRIPHTVIIRPDGRVAAWGHINDVTRELLEKVVAGEDVEQLPSFDDSSFTTGGEDPFGGVSDGSEMLYVVFRPARGAEPMWLSSSKGTTAVVQPAKSLVLSAFGARQSRCEMNAELPEGKFDFIVRSAAPMSQDEKNSLLRIAIEKNFGIVGRREVKNRPVLLVKWTDEARGRLTPTVSTGGAGMTAKAGELSMINVPVEHVCYSMEYTLNRPVLDESNNREKFDITLKWDAKSPESIIEAVRSQLGLEVEEAEREIEVTVIEKAG